MFGNVALWWWDEDVCRLGSTYILVTLAFRKMVSAWQCSNFLMVRRGCLSFGAHTHIYIFNHTIQHRRSQHVRILTPMNTCTQTLPQWAPTKDRAPNRFGDFRSRYWHLVFDDNVAYHLTHNVGNPEKIPRKGASTRIWILMGSVPLDRPTIGLQADLFARSTYLAFPNFW
jgi:hypothetical protein